MKYGIRKNNTFYIVRQYLSLIVDSKTVADCILFHVTLDIKLKVSTEYKVNVARTLRSLIWYFK